MWKYIVRFILRSRIAILAVIVIITGILALLFFHVLQNSGMTMGVMPITGIPLPFISYGGSAMLTNMIAIGIVININIRKKKIMF